MCLSGYQELGFWAAAGINSTTAIAMISGTISAAISSGNLKNASVGGLTAGAFKGVGDKFGHGFVSAGVTQAFSGQIDKIAPDIARSARRIAAAAILGGSTSALTGGKFANGAITGAFSRAFNEVVEGSGRNRNKGTTKYTGSNDVTEALYNGCTSGNTSNCIELFNTNMDDLVIAKQFLRDQYPDTYESINIRSLYFDYSKEFQDLDISGDANRSLNRIRLNPIYIDVEDLVNTLHHENFHLQDSWFGDFRTGLEDTYGIGNHHTNIHIRSSWVTDKYREITTGRATTGRLELK